MSFLSSLFCCFDGDDSNKKESHKTTNRPHLQTNKSNITTNTIPHPPKLSKTQSNLQKALTHTNTNLNNNNNNNPTANSNNTNNKSANKDLDNNNKSSDKDNNNNNNNSSSDNSKNKNNKEMKNSDSQSTNAENSEYKTLIDEIGDKNSTDSSKNEDAVNIHENQTQDTDDTTKFNQNIIPGYDDSPDRDYYSEEEQQQQQYENDSNPISSINSDSDINTNLLYENQFDLDLTKIIDGQTFSQSSGRLLPEKSKKFKGKKCLVLDLDETLVHSSFKYVRQCDFVIPVEIENQIHNVYVIKRPGVDYFLKRVGELYEVVVFTASVSRYGDPLLDILDKHKSVHHRLFRESCYNYQGNYIKNLSQMGRPLEDLIIIDNSPASYVFHPQHAVPISSWFSDSHDCELTDLLPFLEDLASSDVDDIRLVLDINI